MILCCLMISCGFSIYYFIALIIQYYLLLPFLQKYLKRNLIISILSSVVSINTITYLLSVKGLSLPLILYAGPFIVWFAFYMLGVYYSCNSRNYSLITACIIVIVGFLLECAEAYYLQTHFTGGVGIKLSAFIYSFGIVLFVLHPQIETSYKETYFTKLIVYIGKISFGIYLIHCYLIAVVTKFLSIDIWFLRWVIVSLITILVIAIVRRFLPQRHIKYIGFS